MVQVVIFILGIILTIAFLVGGLFIGKFNDKKHMASILAREAAYRGIRLDNRKRVPNPETIEMAAVVNGQYVAASDYFKAFATKLRSLVGGEMKSIMIMMERARREAILRMVEEAKRHGATEIWNIRLETSNINQMAGKQGAAQVELLAYGTAVRRKPA